MDNRPIPQAIYRHFKGNLYQVICVATHSETGEDMVVYQALYGDYRLYVRPLEMFVSQVDHAKYPDVKQKYRFERVTLQDSEPKTGMTGTKIDDEPQLDADVVEFLDATGYGRRLEILGKIKYKITDDMIDIMSTVIDINVPEGDINSRYEHFREALLTRKHYEGSRLR